MLGSVRAPRAGVPCGGLGKGPPGGDCARPRRVPATGDCLRKT